MACRYLSETDKIRYKLDMERYIFDRETKRGGKAQIASSLSLIKKLKVEQKLKVKSGQLSTAAEFSERDPSCVLTGGEDGVLRIWQLFQGSQPTQQYSLDTGHTSSIYAAKFLPHRQSLVATCSADRQVRLIDLESLRTKPYTAHRSRVKALVAISPDILLSGGEDGAVRRWDIREPSPNASADQQSRSLLVDQKSERVGRAGVSVSIHSLAVDPLNPHLFITGGSDPLVRLFDLRMIHKGVPRDPLGPRSPWVSCFVPEHLKEGLLRPPMWYSPTTRRLKTISGVAFTFGGREIVATYNSENIYSFSVDLDSRSYEGLFSPTRGMTSSMMVMDELEGPRPSILSSLGLRGGERRPQEPTLFPHPQPPTSPPLGHQAGSQTIPLPQAAAPLPALTGSRRLRSQMERGGEAEAEATMTRTDAMIQTEPPLHPLLSPSSSVPSNNERRRSPRLAVKSGPSPPEVGKESVRAALPPPSSSSSYQDVAAARPNKKSRLSRMQPSTLPPPPASIPPRLAAPPSSSDQVGASPRILGLRPSHDPRVTRQTPPPPPPSHEPTSHPPTSANNNLMPFSWATRLFHWGAQQQQQQQRIEQIEQQQQQIEQRQQQIEQRSQELERRRQQIEQQQQQIERIQQQIVEGQRGEGLSNSLPQPPLPRPPSTSTHPSSSSQDHLMPPQNDDEGGGGGRRGRGRRGRARARADERGGGEGEVRGGGTYLRDEPAPPLSSVVYQEELLMEAPGINRRDDRAGGRRRGRRGRVEDIPEDGLGGVDGSGGGRGGGPSEGLESRGSMRVISRSQVDPGGVGGGGERNPNSPGSLLRAVLGSVMNMLSHHQAQAQGRADQGPAPPSLTSPRPPHPLGGSQQPASLTSSFSDEQQRARRAALVQSPSEGSERRRGMDLAHPPPPPSTLSNLGLGNGGPSTTGASSPSSFGQPSLLPVQGQGLGLGSRRVSARRRGGAATQAAAAAGREGRGTGRGGGQRSDMDALVDARQVLPPSDAPSHAQHEANDDYGFFPNDDDDDDGPDDDGDNATRTTRGQRGYRRCYEGHRNVMSGKNAVLMGLHSSPFFTQRTSSHGYIASCSDDGHLFVWDRKTGELLNMVPGVGVDSVLASHPWEPMLISCGGSSEAKVWTPTAEEVGLPSMEQKRILAENILMVAQEARSGVSVADGPLGVRPPPLMGHEGGAAMMMRGLQGMMMAATRGFGGPVHGGGGEGEDDDSMPPLVNNQEEEEEEEEEEEQDQQQRGGGPACAQQ